MICRYTRQIICIFFLIILIYMDKKIFNFYYCFSKAIIEMLVDAIRN